MVRLILITFTLLVYANPLFSQSGLLLPYTDVEVFDGQTRKSWGEGINSTQLNTIDIDLDGQDEIVIIDRNAEKITVYSMEDGKYLPNPDLLYLLPDLDRNWAIFADYDCDGDQDIFNYGQTGIVVYQNQLNTEEGGWLKVADPLFTLGFSGKINLLVNAGDLPAIADIDGDGDLDILSYNFVLGEDIYFHQNMSVEKTGKCGDLDFEITDRKWGKFKECECHSYAFGDQTCADISNGRVAHTGGKALVAYDLDSDFDKDIFISHSDCNDQIYLENVGDQQSALFTNYVLPFPNLEEAIAMPIYPTIRFLDSNGNGEDELIAAPNIDFNFEFTSDFSNSVWQYANIGTPSDPAFQLQRKNYLQSDIIDLGELSSPVFFDIDKDGDLDILIATNGKEVEGKFYGRVVLFTNTGNKFSPQFSITDDDFLGLSGLKVNVPTLRLVDVNKDGSKDLFFSGYDLQQGRVRSFIFYNQSKPNQSPIFDPQNSEQVLLPLRIMEIPEFVDVNGDGEVDLLVGERGGALTLYENNGNFNFELVENDYLGIGRDFSGYRLNVHPLVTDYNRDGRQDLMVADTKGITVYYDFTNSASPVSQALKFFNSYLGAEDSISMQKFNSLAIADLYRTGFNSLILGGSGGGLRFYRQKIEVDNPEVIGSNLLVYPNPVISGGIVYIESLNEGWLTIYNLNGQRVKQVKIEEKSVTIINTSTLGSGVYLLEFISEAGEQVTHKIVVTR